MSASRHLSKSSNGWAKQSAYDSGQQLYFVVHLKGPSSCATWVLRMCKRYGDAILFQFLMMGKPESCSSDNLRHVVEALAHCLSFSTSSNCSVLSATFARRLLGKERRPTSSAICFLVRFKTYMKSCISHLRGKELSETGDPMPGTGQWAVPNGHMPAYVTALTS